MEEFLTSLFAKQQFDRDNFFLIAGPCVVESEEMIREVAQKVSGIAKKLAIPYIFKSSYRKAYRTSGSSFTGIGDEVALGMLQQVGKEFPLPVVTDIHSAEKAARRYT